MTINSKIVTGLLLLIIGVQCLHLRQNDYTDIKNDLYKNDCEDMFIKVLLPDNEILYIAVIYSDSFGVDGIKAVKDVIHVESFQKISNNYYKDKKIRTI